MRIQILSAPRVICSNPHGLHNYFAWPSVARLQDGELCMVASGFRLEHVCPFGKVVMCRSRDEGKTWTAPEILLDSPLDDRDAGICPFGEKGVIVTTFNNTIEEQRAVRPDEAYRMAYLDEVEKSGKEEKYLGSLMLISHDGGQSFGAPVKSPVTAPHGPCALRDGSVLYVGYLRERINRHGKHEDVTRAQIACYAVHPDGSTEKRGEIPRLLSDDLCCEPYAIQLPSGRILVHIRVQHKNPKRFTIYQSVSDDLGRTFSEPRQLLGETGGAPAHLLMHSSGTLISTYGYREAPYGIRAMFSRDGGETWETDHVLVDDEPSPDLGYPCSVELRDGSILTVYYGRQGSETWLEKGPSVIKQIVWRVEE